jgi:hypothetical protein
MSEFENWVSILGLLIPAISLLIAVLTYLRVSGKYFSRASNFRREIKSKEFAILFNIKGIGVLQKIEIVATGSPSAMISATVDSIVFLEETFNSLMAKSSAYIRKYQISSPEGIGEFSIEMDLQKNFFASIAVYIDNRHEIQPLKVRGTVHFNIYIPRFRFSLRKKPR